MVGKATKKPWHKSELLGHMDEEQEAQVDFVAVKASSCVQSCEVDHSMDTKETDSVRSDHWPITFSISTETRAQRCGLAVSARVGKMRWRRSGAGTDLQRFLRTGETWREP